MNGASQISWPYTILMVAGLATAGWYLHAHQSKTPEPPPLRVTDWLDHCSPFESLDGMRALEFSINDRSVKMTEAEIGESAVGALAAKHPKITNGTWNADEATKQVVVNFNAGGLSIESSYVLAITFSEDQCILTAGAITSSDLQNSWFGTPYFEPDDDRDPYP
jgi:hypothetical protein